MEQRLEFDRTVDTRIEHHSFDGERRSDFHPDRSPDTAPDRPDIPATTVGTGKAVSFLLIGEIAVDAQHDRIFSGTDERGDVRAKGNEIAMMFSGGFAVDEQRSRITDGIELQNDTAESRRQFEFSGVPAAKV